MRPRLVKYMGSKHKLLSNGLGHLIENESRHATRIVDLFCGGSNIAWFAATRTRLPVLAIDLQQYAVVLARSVISRTEEIYPKGLADHWLNAAINIRESSENWQLAFRIESAYSSMPQRVEASRSLCGDSENSGLIWGAYGGHYFSPAQAATIDAMLDALPNEEPARTICLAATISSGSHCAASPGHTAQPFQPTPGASRYIEEAWDRDPLMLARKALNQICSLHANVAGEAFVGEAVSIASTLTSSDLAFVDPPYSGVQYSRFYHVLETIARGKQEINEGRGRYPPLTARPQSAFSRPSESREALVNLLENLSRAGVTVIFTFPSGKSSNGLSGEIVSEISGRLFNIEKSQVVSGRFSTLGGNNSNRAARSKSEEMVLVLKN